MQNASPPAAGSSSSWLAWMLYLWYYLGWFGCVLLAKAPLVTLFFPLVSWLLLRRIVSLSQARVVFLLALALVGIYALMAVAERRWDQLADLAAGCGFAYGFVRFARDGFSLPRIRWPRKNSRWS